MFFLTRLLVVVANITTCPIWGLTWETKCIKARNDPFLVPADFSSKHDLQFVLDYVINA
jgi:hypothetical protein